MNQPDVISALAALAQDSRLAIYRLLVKRGPEGYAVGEISERLKIAGPSLSFHLKELANAGLVLSLFGVAMMAGRFLTSMVKNLTQIGVRLIAVMALVAAAAILTMILTTSPALAVVAVVLTGLAFAPIFPTIVGVTFAKFEPKLYGSIFGIIFSVGLLGATFVPKIVGNLSRGATIQQSLYIVFAMAVALFVIAMFLGSGSRKSGTAR